MEMLQIAGLHKRFGDKEVLKGLNLTVPEHSIFGFIGRNGAGKTTTMKTILGLLKADAGEILVNGEKAVYGQTATNRYIGYLPDVPEFYSFMTAREYLGFCGEITGMTKKEYRERSEELLELVGLNGEKHRIKGYSRGMKQRLGIAQALLNRPKLLICDEPTSALDPVGRKEILDLLLGAFQSVEASEDVPGASPVNCGNYLMHNLPMAKWYARRFADYLAKNRDNQNIFDIPLTEIQQKNKSQVYF